MSVPNLKSLVTRIRKQYPAMMTAAQVGEAVYRIASAAQAMGHDLGVLLKKSGHRVPSPLGEISSDILIDIPDEQEYDVFTNADGGDTKKPQAGAVWNKLKSKVGGSHSGAKMENVRRPAGVTPPAPVPPAPIPPPTPVPAPPVPCQCGEVVETLAAMAQRAEERYDAMLSVLARLEDDNRKARPFTGSARFIGTLTGEVGGVSGD